MLALRRAHLERTRGDFRHIGAIETVAEDDADEIIGLRRGERKRFKRRRGVNERFLIRACRKDILGVSGRRLGG